MSSRFFRHAQSSTEALSKNADHQFSANHAVALYARNMIFSFIPKNGCTTLRYSAALENQMIEGPENLGWIHNNNASFRPSLRELLTADYTFVVLRCPFRRLVSCFLHKIVDRSLPAKNLQVRALAHRLHLSARMERRFDKLLHRHIAARPAVLDAVTFADFVSQLETPGALATEIHWRPQVDFLVYRSYDDVFRLEDMDSCVATVHAKTGFVVHDSRKVTNHGNHNRTHIENGFSGHTDVRTLRKLKQEMKVPAYEQFYNADLYQRVNRLYRADVELYATHFGQSALLQLQ